MKTLSSYYNKFLKTKSEDQLIEDLFQYLATQTEFFADQKRSKKTVLHAFLTATELFDKQEDDWEILSKDLPQKEEQQQAPQKPLPKPKKQKKIKQPKKPQPTKKDERILQKEFNTLARIQWELQNTAINTPTLKKLAPLAAPAEASTPAKKIINNKESSTQYESTIRKQQENSSQTQIEEAIPLPYNDAIPLPYQTPVIPLPYLYPPINNGGKCEKYAWTQSINEIQLNINIPQLIRCKDLFISIKPEDIYIKYRKTGKVILDKHLLKKIDPLDSYWQLENIEPQQDKKNKDLVIYLQKETKFQYWQGVFKGDPMIDTQLITPSPEDQMLHDQNYKNEDICNTYLRQQSYNESYILNKMARQNMMQTLFNQNPSLINKYSS